MINARENTHWTAEDQTEFERRVKESDAKHFHDTILADREAGKLLKQDAARQDLKEALKILNDHGIDVIESLKAANDTIDAAMQRITELEAELAAMKAGKAE